MDKIALRNGEFTLLDREDFLKYNKYRWCTTHGRVMRKYKSGKGIYLHRLIMKAPTDKEVDHINGNTLDNRKSNLRICNHNENLRNQKIKSNNTSGFKGVTWKKDKRKWKAYLKLNYKQIHLGYFNNRLEAARKYDEAASIYFGQYARLNFR